MGSGRRKVEVLVEREFDEFLSGQLRYHVKIVNHVLEQRPCLSYPEPGGKSEVTWHSKKTI